MMSVIDMKNDELVDKINELEARIVRLERIAGEQRRHSIAYTPQDMTYK